MKKSKVIQVLLVLMGVLCIFSGCNKKDESTDESAPTSSITMTESEAAALGEKVRVVLYFTDKKGTNLFCENQLLEFTARDRRTENMAKKICEALVAGPADKDKYASTFPKEAVVRSVTISQGVATVDFNENFTEKLSDQAAKLDLMMSALANTLTELKDVTKVAVTVNGKALGKMSNGYEFKVATRNMNIMGSEPAASEVEYTEEAFVDVPLE